MSAGVRCLAILLVVFALANQRGGTPQDGNDGLINPSTPLRSALVDESAPGYPWSLLFVDNFEVDAAEGSFLRLYGDRWTAYPKEFRDTSGNGQYNADILRVEDGVLSMRLHTDSSGVAQVAAPSPQINGDGNNPNQLYGRYEVRFRADPVAGFKTAWLLWPESERWPQDGEIDYPEGNLTAAIGAAMHYKDGKSADDKDHFTAEVTYDQWHTAVLEWGPDKVTFLLDGDVLGSSTQRIPDKPMRWVLQTETELEGDSPHPWATGDVQVDYVKVWQHVAK